MSEVLLAAIFAGATESTTSTVLEAPPAPPTSGGRCTQPYESRRHRPSQTGPGQFLPDGIVSRDHHAGRSIRTLFTQPVLLANRCWLAHARRGRCQVVRSRLSSSMRSGPFSSAASSRPNATPARATSHRSPRDRAARAAPRWAARRPSGMADQQARRSRRRALPLASRATRFRARL
jgi:hypothetical protein